jgi:hypothetical protein
MHFKHDRTFFEKYQYGLKKKPPTKEEATEIIRKAALEGNVHFETEGTTIECKCNGCGVEMAVTFFKREYDIAEDTGPCHCGGTWERKHDE